MKNDRKDGGVPVEVFNRALKSLGKPKSKKEKKKLVDKNTRKGKLE